MDRYDESERTPVNGPRRIWLVVPATIYISAPYRRTRPQPSLGDGSRRFEADHRVGAHVFAVTGGEAAVRTLDLEPEHPVERDADGVCKYETSA